MSKLTKTIKFWTPKEEKQLLKAVQAGGKVKETIANFAKISGRTEKSVTLRVVRLRKELGISRKINTSVKRGRPVGSKNSNPLNTSTQRGVELPGGFVFNFTPKKAEMYDNHVRLYF